ncbi:hypothetical protein [Glutamicibacter arilaitensis]|uniref:Uncharacterized protein n=1 Tax=Glutamicibacter arilaitensis TaxID=256701 RepID=A0A2N7S5M8_9MICC|nr:hypothetical protein [Glutamicibacter arilaitensis]PMQ21450.1 hypothetical protein CIK84_07870 [Glutamicibacter arilaitensis]
MRIDSLDVFDDALLRAACQLEAAANQKRLRAGKGIGTEPRTCNFTASRISTKACSAKRWTVSADRYPSGNR